MGAGKPAKRPVQATHIPRPCLTYTSTCPQDTRIPHAEPQHEHPDLQHFRPVPRTGHHHPRHPLL
ncbi:hypothetical protein CXG50_18445 [Pseudomonas plecoglossicida]|uniref:Uncharacterized protein n=1 Tax=Pseudomonas plecoglossicida TaxID=70775 RepID=A0ABX4UAK1_PSEDL|nr:hypothetical protein CSW00_18980 [Pseudomonas sp. MR 02]PLP92756.1 hypothetical protein CX682_07100 [Pseudomonas sp. FFUP_PS_41]PLU86734.1 hypothetical protein CXG44_13720 [Pseudomonas plecoglossicida]PLU92140.1 hypothetical protein CXG45_16065 [Pseudomonas plecoglossicida]PLU96859.1 hypothetical protein CXG52_17285 [Pseudomonas plecoglossicida]